MRSDYLGSGNFLLYKRCCFWRIASPKKSDRVNSWRTFLIVRHYFFKKMTCKAKIIGTGSYLPEKILTNLDLEQMVETSDEWIVTRTGIKERRIAEAGEYTSAMGARAAMRAIEDAGLQPTDIDYIIVATLTPDYLFPSTACLIQKEIGAKSSSALYIQAACTGYLYALSLAKALVETKMHKNILIVAAEKLSSITDYKDRSTC